MTEGERIYRSHHRHSRLRGCVVRLIVGPSSKRRPNNVLVEVLEEAPADFPNPCLRDDAGRPGDRFVCPWRALRRLRTQEATT